MAQASSGWCYSRTPLPGASLPRAPLNWLGTDARLLRGSDGRTLLIVKTQILIVLCCAFQVAASAQNEFNWTDSVYTVGQEREIEIEYSIVRYPGLERPPLLYDSIVDMLVRRPGLVIEISAHTDQRDSEDRNLTLSQRRAQSLKDYCVSKGIAPERILAVGHGEEQLIIKDDSIKRLATAAEREEAFAVNRRTIIRIVSIGP